MPTNNRWIQRIIALANAAATGFLADRITHSPLIGAGIGIVASVILWKMVSSKPLIGTFFKLTLEASQVLRTVLMSLTFFIICTIAAFLTLSQ